MATIKDLKRMCRSFYICSNCPLEENCKSDFPVENLPDNADEIVDRWVEEHPVKTYIQNFFEKFPNAPRTGQGTPEVCPDRIYPELDVDRCCEDCLKCWNREMKEE